MKIKVNGETVSINTKSTATSLDFVVSQLGHHPKLVVVELNGQIIQPTSWAQQKVRDGDNLEIVTIVGGGS